MASEMQARRLKVIPEVLTFQDKKPKKISPQTTLRGLTQQAPEEA